MTTHQVGNIYKNSDSSDDRYMLVASELNDSGAHPKVNLINLFTGWLWAESFEITDIYTITDEEFKLLVGVEDVIFEYEGRLKEYTIL